MSMLTAGSIIRVCRGRRRENGVPTDSIRAAAICLRCTCSCAHDVGVSVLLVYLVQVLDGSFSSEECRVMDFCSSSQSCHKLYKSGSCVRIKIKIKNSNHSRSKSVSDPLCFVLGLLGRTSACHSFMDLPPVTK